jgi:hypothetical protein
MVAGCAGSLVGDAIAGPEKLAQQDDAYCTSIGLQLGQPDYARCRMMREEARERWHRNLLGCHLRRGLSLRRVLLQVGEL